MNPHFRAEERAAVDAHLKVVAASLHRLDPAFADRLRRILQATEGQLPDATLARVLVTSEIMRGINHGARAPLTVRAASMPANLARCLADAESLGRALSPHATGRRRGLLGWFTKRRDRLSKKGLVALMRCRAIASAQERRHAAAGASAVVRAG